MKRILFAVGAAAIIAAGIAAVCIRRTKRNTDDIDGGVVKRYWADVPKVIESAEIETFHYEVSLFAVCDTDDLGHRIYRLDAVSCGDEVSIAYDWRDRMGNGDNGEYKADAEFMVRLQEIIAEYDFAQHNGYYHSVSGLPGMYGESLDVVYTSGECINVHDNQSGFLPLDAVRALVALFGAVTKLENQ